MTIRKIAICGARGSGKNTVASMLVELNQNNAVIRKYEFSDPIKNVIMSAFNLKLPSDYEVFKRGTVITPSGREVSCKEIIRSISLNMRSFDNGRFIDDVDYRIRCAINDNRDENLYIVISDLKFKDELKWCRENGVVIIKVKRANAQFDSKNVGQEIDDFFCDYVIQNDDSEDGLREEVISVNRKINAR